MAKHGQRPRKTIHKNSSKHLKTREYCLRSKKLSTNPLPLTIRFSATTKSPPFASSNRSLVLLERSIYLIPSRRDSSPSLQPWMIMAEESNPGIIQRLRHPLTTKRVENLHLDLSQARKLAHGYKFKGCGRVHKVLLCTPNATSPDSSEFMVFYGKGELCKLTARAPESQAQYDWEKLKRRSKKRDAFWYLDDVVEFKGQYCALDRRGKLYEVNIKEMTVASVMESEGIVEGTMDDSRRKRLVVDPTSQELYVVERRMKAEKKKVGFNLYKFNERDGRWNVVVELGSERVLLVGIKHCFFAKSEDFTMCNGNSIVFAANCFTSYRGCDSPDPADRELFGHEGVHVGVYRLGEGDNFTKLIWWPSRSGYNNEETALGSSSQRASNPDDNIDEHTKGMLIESSGEGSSDKVEGDEEMQPDPSSSESNEASDSNGVTGSDESGEEEVQSSSFSQQPCDFGTSKMDCQKNVECSGPNFSTAIVCHANSTTHAMTPPVTHLTSSKVTFEGLEINPELLPTLQTIWTKRGSLIGDDTINNEDIRATALESAAKLVIKLQNTTGRSLTDSKANKIKSDLSSLQQVGLKVDWLVPTVERAGEVLRTKRLKEHIERIDKEIARIDQEEKEFRARIAKKKQELQKQEASLYAKILPWEEIGPDDSLGELFF